MTKWIKHAELLARKSRKNEYKGFTYTKVNNCCRDVVNDKILQ